MHIRRLIVTVAALAVALAAAAPVAAHGPGHDNDRYSVQVLLTGPSPDGDLVNAWGLTSGLNTPWWIADNGTNLTTVHNADGSQRTVPRVGIVDGAPTGAVFNGNAVDSNGNALDFKGDLFIFDGESGNIFGWRGALGVTGNAAIENGDHAGDAVYKGLAIGTADVGDGSQQYLYATDFHNGRIDVFDRTFASQTWSGAFVDRHLPKHYAPFGIQNLNGMLFVTYAQTQKGSADEKAGHGRGVVDAFATDGTFLGRVATHGSLNAPWGLAWAPADFGRFSNDLIVGNFGDGKLNAYRWDGHHWHHDGQLKASGHGPVVIDGLWAIAFGKGNLTNNGPTNTLFYTAGPNEEAGGAFGTITADMP